MQSRVLAILIAVVLALVATAAMVVYVNGADRRAISDQQPVLVLVAVGTIKAGTSGEDAQNAKLIERREVPKSAVVPGAVRGVAQLQGKRAAVDIVAGEQLLLKRWVGGGEVEGRRLLPIEEGHQALSIGLDLTRQVAGFVTPGDKVSMVLTMPRPGPNGGEAVDTTDFLLQNVQVLAVGATALTNASAQGGGRVNQGKGSQNLTAITFAIPKQHVRRVVFAAENGSIYLTLLPPTEEGAVPTGNGVDAGNVISRGGQ
jgi:pilus assembly protein CpaB